MSAEEEWRTWTSTAGTSLEARVVSAEGDQVTLERKGGGSLKVKLGQLSQEDRDFLAEWRKPKNAVGEPRVEGVDAEPGQVSGEIQCAGDSQWSYHLYLPQEFHTGRNWPVCFVMDPGGGSPGTLDRYKPAAERYGIILAVSKQSKNDFADSDEAMMAMNRDVRERLPVVEGLAFASGMSGGSRMAYLMSEMDKDIAGVVACGSGGGVYLKEKDFRPVRLRKSVIVCSLMGTNCFNRSEAAASHKTFPKAARLIWFAGNHDWANAELIEEAMAHVYGSTLRESREKEHEPLREAFAAEQMSWARTKVSDEPWAALRWARFLADFPSVASDARALEGSLTGLERAEKGLEVEKEMNEFAEDHFTLGDHTADASREKAATKLAEKFSDLPQAELIKRMGEPSVAP
ncbi:hypothetical protein [Haloferula sargassicola]|uniref:SLA1 homology domain-containing protein n=1 Tax=Haloferula sargassicola TaxID=490096 RepID=A0ABP9UI66_9BACT